MNIFIDGGAHCGCSRKKFCELYGNDYQIYSFEPDPSFNEFCSELINKALWNSDGSINFYKYRLSGASSLLKKRAELIIKEKPTSVDLVPTIDIHKWIVSNFSKNDYIILKLDVEGSEYSILPHMLKNNTFEYIDKLFIEWHNHRVGIDKSTDINLTKQIKNQYNIDIELWDAMKSGHCIGQLR